MIKINLYKINYFCLFLIFCSLLIVSCSSAPKEIGDIKILRSQAEAWLEAGNKEAGQGKFKNALTILSEAKSNAIMADDISLIIRVCLSRGNVLYSLGNKKDAFEEWNHAVSEAEKFGNPELLSVSKIYLARGNLISEERDAELVYKEVNNESEKISKSRLYIAFSWQVKGLALRAMALNKEAEKERDEAKVLFKNAEAAFMRSLEINEKDLYLENASYDWYIIASIRSLSGYPDEAVKALESSIAVDRRIENSWGIAASYRAMGDVYFNTDKLKAKEAYIRARTIYAAMLNEEETAVMDKRIGSLK